MAHSILLSFYFISILFTSLYFIKSNAFIPSSSSSSAATSSFQSTVIHNPSMILSQLNNSNNSNNNNNNNNNNVQQQTQNQKNTIGTWNPIRLAVLKLKFTEMQYTSPLNYEKRQGVYKCANCNNILFDSNGKYDSKSGWPSFWKTSSQYDDGSGGRVLYKREWDGRMEIQCSNCRGHLGM